MRIQVIFLATILALAGTSAARAAGLDDALAALNAGDHRRAVLLLKPLALRGEAEAQYQLANLYTLGQGVSTDYEAAAQWMERAAEQEHRFAARALGDMYSAGMGVSRDEQAAIRWYTLAQQLAERDGVQEDDCD